MPKQGSGRRKSLLIAGLISSSLLLVSLVSLSTTTRAETSSPFRVPCRKIIDNGPDKDRIVLLIAGEGYTKDQSQLFKGDIDRLITQGILGHDFFKDNFSFQCLCDRELVQRIRRQYWQRTKERHRFQ